MSIAYTSWGYEYTLDDEGKSPPSHNHSWGTRPTKTGNIMAELADILGFRVSFDSLKEPLYGLNRQVGNVFLVCSYN